MDIVDILGFYVSGTRIEGVEESPDTYASLVQCIDEDISNCVFIFSPLDGYYINKGTDATAKANQIISCNNDSYSIETTTPSTNTCIASGKPVYNSGLKICITTSDANPEAIPHTGSDLYKTIEVTNTNDFPHVINCKTVIVKMEPMIVPPLNLDKTDTDIITTMSADNQGDQLYKCTNNECSKTAVEEAVDGYYINAANKKNFIICDSSSYELVTLELGFIKLKIINMFNVLE